MADLIQEFFQRDLSEVEHEALNRLLNESPDAVSRYEKFLEQNYMATGLPQPTLPQGLQSLPLTGNGMAGGSLVAKFLLMALAGAGVLAWKYWPHRSLETALPAAQTSLPLKAVQPKLNVQTALAPKVEPQAASPSAEGQELSVVVDAAQAALVTVRILNPQGREIRALYTGFVQPGHWSFQWDGLLSDGQPAPAGDYHIDVQSGASHESKEITIKLK